MSQPTFKITGHILHSHTSQGISGLRVEAWDRDLIFNDLIGSSVTDAEGKFSIEFTAAYFQECFLDRRPDLFFQVFNANNEQIASTEDSVLWNQSQDNQDIVISVDLPNTDDDNEPLERFVVKGHVYRPDGTPYAGIFVRAFDKDLRSEQALGTRRTTSQTGFYEISYTPIQFCRADKHNADLIVRAYGGTGDALLAESDILFNAQPVEVVDLAVTDDEIPTPSDYDRLMATLQPLLRDQAIADLREDLADDPEAGQFRDLSFLSGETELPKPTLARLVMAHRLAQQAVQPEFWFALLTPTFYPFAEDQDLEQQQAELLETLPSLDDEAVRKSLTRSVNQNEIPDAHRESIDEWVEAFLEFVADQTANAEAKPTFVKLALDDAEIRVPAKRQKFARLFNQYKALSPQLLKSLEQDETFTQPEIDDLQASFQLASLTQGDFSVVKMVKTEFGVRQPAQVRQLAKKSVHDWANVVSEKYEAGEIRLPLELGKIGDVIQLPTAQLYGQMLERQFREAFPTMAFAGGLERSLQNGGTHGIHRATDLSRFLARHDSFEFLNTSVDDFLQNGIHPDFQELAHNNAFRLELKALQRVFKLAPTFAATDTLLADNLHSAQAIYRLGESQFVRRYGDQPGFTPESARLAWNRAADTHAAVVSLITDLKAYEAQTLPASMKYDDQALADSFPNWKNLFNTGDLCECSHCNSVLSPAAYFTELLMFLEDREAKTSGKTVKDILFKRRPDLGFLELNCDNALVTLPYIDVVCEVLEAAIDSEGANHLTLPDDLKSLPEDIDEAKARVTDAFQAQGIDLGDNVSLSRVDESNPNDWVVHGDNVTYRLTKRNASPPFVAEVLPNTKASAAELRAYPQYVNPVAYDTLRQAKYPFVLPFDLYAAEVRAAFQKTNLKRWELMQVFQGSTEPNNPSAGDIAAEYFGISVGEPGPSEKTLILEAAPTLNQQQERWGERHFNTLSNVNTFLRKTSLEYNDLLTLLDLKFINPSEEIFIQHLDSSCDTVQKVIQGLNATNLDRIHRFLRLWRKLKTWEMWELDLVIRQPGVGNQESNQEWQLNETFLINLFYFSQIQKQLGQKTTVEQVCALFGNLNTETHFTELHAKREDALYQNLFLNRKLIQPLETAFEVDKVDVAEPTTAKMSTYHPAIQAALRIREPYLILLKELAKATDSAADMSDDLDLTLSNLSFLWRQAWLAKTLKFKIPEWAIVLKLFQWDSGAFSTPKAAWEFLEKIDHLKASGFKLDELNWLLTGDRTAKAAPKETDATRFLTTLRQELQRIRAEYDPEQYDFLTAEPPTDLDQLTTLLTSLLQKLNRSEAEIATFLKVLQSRIMLTAPIQVLPAGFRFPEEIIAAPNNIPIEYDEPNRQVRFKSLMTKAQRDTLLRSDSPILAILRSDSQLKTSVEAIPTDFTFPTAIVGAPNHIPIQYEASTQQLRFMGLMTQTQWDTLTQEASPALVALYASGQLEASVEGLPTGFAFPDAVVGAPHNIPIQYDETNQRLRFTGLMSEAQQTILLNEAALPTGANDAAYRTAIEALYQQSLAVVNHYRSAIEALYQQSLAVVNHYRSAIETLYQQSLTATTSHWVMEKTVDLPGVFVFPVTITGSPNAIPIRCEQVIRFTGTMTAEQKNILLTDSALAAVKDREDYQQAIHALFERPERPVSIRNLPENFSLPASITEAPNEIPIRLEQALRFTGVMTEDQKNTLLTDAPLAAVKDVEDYQQAIAAFFEHPRLAVKFFDPVFKAFLAKLPAEIDFQGQLPPDLAAKITYDTEQEHLSFTGIMSDAEWEDLLSLSEDTAYQTVVSQLFTQPNDIDPEDERVWLSDIDLDMTQANTDTYAKRLANAVKKALRHLLKTSAENAVVQQSSAQLGLTEALSRYLLSHYAIVPYFLHLNPPLPPIWLRKPLLAHLAEAFTIDATTINAWFWANRVAAILQEWKITLAELKKIAALTDENNEAQLLDFGTLPLDEEEPITSIDNFLQTSRLMHQRDRLPETHISLLSILNNLRVEGYGEADFATDVARLNEDWSAANMEQLIEVLTFSYPDDYLLAETWERLRRAFYFLDTLNAETDTVKAFAAPVMTDADAKTLKGLLRSKFGSETWLTISTETQDVLRERKRDALAAYLLSQPQPKDIPSGKWENTNDLYAYYLLDAEMSSCQLTSRLVQGSGSIQLFVQRCFMGLEPDVIVQADGADGDSAWRWWQWMRKYRVWEANRKVFLWPENWIEPELKKDRSSFFKDLENELLQNELNPYTIETAFTHYLEKLHDVAQLEIAGFYQEDDGDNTIIHVFGRTKGTEPHHYYYRRYDYRQWTPWEKVELDIQGDYLIPAVVNKRLFLFWPVFMEVPDEEGNSEVTVPAQSGKETSFKPDKTKKRLRLQMAVSDYRQGKWSPKKISIANDESTQYSGESLRKNHQFFLVDTRRIDGNFGIGYECSSAINDDGSYYVSRLNGTFNISGCEGIPVRKYSHYNFSHALHPPEEDVEKDPFFLKWVELEDRISNDFRLDSSSLGSRLNLSSQKTEGLVYAGVTAKSKSIKILDQTTSQSYKMFPAWHLSFLDELLLDGFKEVNPTSFARGGPPPNGTWLPYFYNDSKRTFLVLPSLPKVDYSFGSVMILLTSVVGNYYYPEIKQSFREREDLFEGRIRSTRIINSKKGGSIWFGLDDFSPNIWLSGQYHAYVETLIKSPKHRKEWEQELLKTFPDEPQPYTDQKFRELIQRWLENKLSKAFPKESKPPYKPKKFKELLRRWWELGLAVKFHSDADATPPPYSDEKFRELTRRWLMRYVHYYLGGLSVSLFQFRQFHFKNFYHPFVCDFAKLVYNPIQGIPSLMSRETQLKNSGFQFANTYRPTPWVVAQPDDPQLPAYPKEEVDFTPDGAYSPYNWELFFHIPLLIANSLSKNQRFEEARDWYHYIFNPLGVESSMPGGSLMSKYWITKPFFQTTKQDYLQQRIENILRMLAGDETVTGHSDQVKKDLEDQVVDWRTNPFEPHRIANYRTVAYQKTVVMKYLDNLIAWGDYLFRQDSMESINEATQLYILAAEILGPRPQKIPPQVKPPMRSFNELETHFGEFSNALVQVENLVPVMPGNGQNGGNIAPLPMLFFCIPQNDQMLSYWDTVADRLYKIRHCMNIEGVVRQLALFEPPIDPGALVKAVAGGLDIGSALADLNAPLPLYRFNFLLQKANEVCNDVKALGSALLSVLEKKDAEALSLLRQDQEIKLLEAIKAIRETQIEEANEALEGLKQSKVVIEVRRDYYRDIEKIIAGEQLSLDKLQQAHKHQNTAQGLQIAASVLGYIPNVTIGGSGFGGSPHVNVQWGTGNIISALQAAAASETQLSNMASYEANRSTTLASYERRFSDWKLQENIAEEELVQIDKQIEAAKRRIEIAEKELENHELQIENAKATDEFMRSKYTNQELYQWQIGQISGVYFQSYQLAYDLAKQAERCFQFELGIHESRYIQFGYWDSLKKGLLSGEKLQYDLRRLEAAYLENNRREFELTKHVSLALLDPLALVKLRETGRCFINLPEEVFDLDYPGHYFRRVKSVSITLPCVVGPYTTISCTLRLLKNSIRINTKNGDNGYPRNTDDQGLPADDDRFIENNIPVKAIAASNAQNDSGVFELSFRDERYLPFEGAGAISQWSLEMFNDLPANNPDPGNPDFGRPLRQFDYSTISDAILHIKYTAREDAGAFKNGAISHLRDYFSQDESTPALRLISLRQEFPAQWHRFLKPSNPADGNVFELEMSPSLFPIRDKDKALKVNAVWLLARCTESSSYEVEITTPGDSSTITLAQMSLAQVNKYGGLYFSAKDELGIELVPAAIPVTKWHLKMTRSGGRNLQTDSSKVEDVILVLGYQWEEF